MINRAFLIISRIPLRTLELLASSRIARRMFVAKNVCHGVQWTAALQATLKQRLAERGGDVRRGLATMIYALDRYLEDRGVAKAMHDLVGGDRQVEAEVVGDAAAGEGALGRHGAASVVQVGRSGGRVRGSTSARCPVRPGLGRGERRSGARGCVRLRRAGARTAAACRAAGPGRRSCRRRG